MVEVYDVNNNRIKCEVLFTFKNNDRDFVVYMDMDDEILSSYYKEVDGKFVIEPIIDEDDYEIVDIELEKWWNQNGE